MYLLSGGTDPGRDGCRVPLPWRAGSPTSVSRRSRSPPGFPSRPGGGLRGRHPGRRRGVDAQPLPPGALRAPHRPGLAGEDFAWIDSDAGVLAFARGRGDDEVTCLVNLGPTPVALPAGAHVLLSSAALHDDQLEPDNAVWLGHHKKEK
ncbi:DUF3459 domain-containing protein [Tessaracoccus coleopterorum]|uniref:DUF3459 domain-containing protein n=1 Tax=Tessaracoccus coleopterorum TaxID=2714950 RepID=UPI002F911DA2